MQRAHKNTVSLALAALATGAALPVAGGAQAARQGCVAPEVVGVNLAMARQALRSSGCAVTVRQLPAHGSFVTPGSPDGRQIVARQTPNAGGHSQAVTVWVKPLCAQPAQPGPERRGAAQSPGPTELVAGLYLQGGPVQTSPHCRRAFPEAGIVTVSTRGGKAVASRRVRTGHFAIFPLRPGSYVLDGTLSGGPGSAPRDVPATSFTIVAQRTTHLNVVAAVG
jgi:hypothetical protein